MKSTNSPLLILLSSILLHRYSSNAAEYHICGTSYMDAETNCRTNPKCFNGEIAVGTPPNDCPEEMPTCFTILSTEELCGEDGSDIQTGGDATTPTTPTPPATVSTTSTTEPPLVDTTSTTGTTEAPLIDTTTMVADSNTGETTIPEISDPLLIEPIPDTPPNNGEEENNNNNPYLYNT